MVLTRQCIKFLPKWGFIDMPDSRRVHVKPIPRGGGMAIIAAFYLFSVITAYFYAGAREYLCVLAPPSAIIILCGFLDDRFCLSAKVKLLAQIVAALLLWWSPLAENPPRLEFFFFDLPEWASPFITVFLVVAIVNAFNLIDGLDGVAAGLSIISAVCLGVWAITILHNPPLLLLSLILAAACLGFLRYNFSPAKIFMGDTGSNFLGFFFAVSCINSMTAEATSVAILVPLMAIGVPIFDVFLAFWRRLLRKISSHGHDKGIMSADMDHLHHRLFAQCHNQRTTALILYALAGVFALAGLFMMLVKHGSAALGYFVIVLVAFMAVRKLATVEMVDSAKMILRGVSTPKRNLLFILSHPVFDLICIILAYVLANILIKKPMFDLKWNTAPFILVIYFTLIFGGIYKIFWFRSSVRDYRYLGEMLFFGSLLALMANRLFDGPWTVTQAVIFFLLTAFFILGERMTLHYFESWVVRQLFVRRAASQTQVDNVVIFGGGQGCRTYLACMGYIYEDLFKVIGILDDDKALHGLTVYGYKVLGGRDELAEVFERTPFQRIVVTSSNIGNPAIEDLRSFAAKYKIKIYRFIPEAIDITPNELIPTGQNE